MIRKYVVFPVYLDLKTFLKTFWEVVLFRLMFNRKLLLPHADGGRRVL
jgi:hypothetical protein